MDSLTFSIANIIGLSLDAIGVTLIFFFGLARSRPLSGAEPITTVVVDMGANRRKAILYRILSWSGWILLLVGFGFQIWANWVIKPL